MTADASAGILPKPLAEVEVSNNTQQQSADNTTPIMFFMGNEDLIPCPIHEGETTDFGHSEWHRLMQYARTENGCPVIIVDVGDNEILYFIEGDRYPEGTVEGMPDAIRGEDVPIEVLNTTVGRTEFKILHPCRVQLHPPGHGGEASFSINILLPLSEQRRAQQESDRRLTERRSGPGDSSRGFRKLPRRQGPGRRRYDLDAVTAYVELILEEGAPPSYDDSTAENHRITGEHPIAEDPDEEGVPTERNIAPE